MERIPSPPIQKESEHTKREALREQIFQQLVASQLLEHFHEEMDDAELPSEAYEEISSTFASLSEENKRAVLAIPAQLRPNIFSKYAEQVRAGKMSGSEVIFDILTKANKYHFTLGFHLSPREIKPTKDGSWVIKGSEPDHRHNDLPMAYYSLDYTHRYQKKPMQYLYVVRAETGPETSQYQDNDGTWGHASSLSIVDAMDLRELEQIMDTRMKMLDEIKRKGDAGKPDVSLD